MSNFIQDLPMHSVPLLQGFLREYQTDRLVGISATDFEHAISDFLNLSDFANEGLSSAEQQRYFSVNFHWGHDHDFGTFALNGLMGTRHIWMLSRSLDAFAALPQDLTGKQVLDVGCWTGGVSLLAAKMGAEVLAIDEVHKYTECLNLLAKSFGLTNLEAQSLSLYNLNSPEYFDRFDHIFCYGVIYHLSDPIIALRTLYNCLKPGGVLHLESMAIESDEPLCRYAGPSANRGNIGWNWFIPSLPALKHLLIDAGFEVTGIGNGIAENITEGTDPLGPGRVMAVAQKHEQKDITRAGLSNRLIR